MSALAFVDVISLEIHIISHRTLNFWLMQYIESIQEQYSDLYVIS